jgi:hypothetical protein
MNQQVFKFVTWGVVGSAVLSSVWLAANVPVSELRALKNIGQEGSLIPLPTEPTAAGPVERAASSATTGQ